MRDDFAIFILTHGRPGKIKTVNMLRRQGYTGKYYIILDNEDKTIDEHIKLFGESNVIIFDKAKVAEQFDVCDNFKGRNVIVYARNACWHIARSLGLKYFAEFEDDYIQIDHRYEEEGKLKGVPINLDKVSNAMINFLDKTKNTSLQTIAFCQGGDFIGGLKGPVWRHGFRRKAMNSFYFRVPPTKDDDLKFIGRMNDDVNTYVVNGIRGDLFLSTGFVNLVQMETQQQKGGNTEAYKDYGTYVKSFYSVMVAPSCVKIGVMGDGHYRIHHKVYGEKAYPKILKEKL